MKKTLKKIFTFLKRVFKCKCNKLKSIRKKMKGGKSMKGMKGMKGRKSMKGG